MHGVYSNRSIDTMQKRCLDENAWRTNALLIKSTRMMMMMMILQHAADDDSRFHPHDHNSVLSTWDMPETLRRTERRKRSTARRPCVMCGRVVRSGRRPTSDRTTTGISSTATDWRNGPSMIIELEKQQERTPRRVLHHFPLGRMKKIVRVYGCIRVKIRSLI